MSIRVSSIVFTLSALLMGSLCGLSQSTGQVKTLRGSVHPLAAVSADNGLLPDFTPLPNLKIYIGPTPAKRIALEKLLVDQRTEGTSTFHHWLTPEQFGQKFGVSASDEVTVRSWLASQGFTGIKLSKSRTVFSFSGTVGQASAAFHTSIHSLTYKGQKHFANTSAISLPQSVSKLVLAVTGLNNFYLTPHNALSGQDQPQYAATSASTPVLAPGDIALEYDLNRLYSSGIDGTGITVVVIGASDIDLNDIRNYRAAFHLPANDPTILLVPGSTDPGHNENEYEADMDLEFLGAVARGANLLYVEGSDTEAAFQYAIDQNLGSVISDSFGSSEYIGEPWGEMQASKEFLVQQANAQGITILAASGDAGAANQDKGLRVTVNGQSVAVATHGLTVDWPADVPEITAVGGTSLPKDASGGIKQWFSNSNDAYGTSLLTYTPEVTWNESMVPSSLEIGSITASGGGKSLLYPKPAWQQGPGVPADGARDVPDVSMIAGTPGYIICTSVVSNGKTDGACKPGSMPNLVPITNGGTGGGSASGTSASTPVFAGIVALLNQYLLKNGTIPSPGLGNINPNLYQLAASTTDVFHDVTQGNNMVPCLVGSPDCTGTGTFGTEGYNAAPGYDLATGLGSVDGYNLAYEWALHSLAPTTLTLTASQQPVLVGQTVTLTATVAANGGTPSGTVSFYSLTNVYSQAALLGTVTVDSNEVATITIGPIANNIGAFYAEYSGVTGYSPSFGGPVTVFPAAVPTTTTLAASSSEITSGSSVTLTANVTPASGTLTGGAVTFTDGTTTLGTTDLSGGKADLSIATLSAGSHSITATYQPSAGTNYSVSTSAPVTVKVDGPDFTLTATPSSLTTTAGSTASTTLNVAPLYGFSGATPTIACSGLPTGATCASGTPAKQNDGSTNIPLKITTATTTAAVERMQFRSGFCLAFLPLLFCLGRRRKAFVRALYGFVLFASLAVFGLGASGCGGGPGSSIGGGQGGNTPTTSTVTVTASSAGISHQVQITLTVN
jgi:subtilase family serine protease